MKTHEQHPDQSSRQIPAQRKDRSISVSDNRPESATQSQLFATVRSGQPSPLVSLVAQGRASHSPAMIQKKGVVQRCGWRDSLKIECANGEAAIWAAAFIVKLENGRLLMNELKLQGIKIYSTIEDNRLIVTFFGEQQPTNIDVVKNVKQYINTYATMPRNQPIPSSGEAKKEKPTMLEKIHAPNNFQSVKNQNILTKLPAEESSTLYLVGQGLFAVGTGEEFPDGFFTDGAGPCVAIAIKCENGIFALGHFDSDVNGGETKEAPCDKTKIDDAIRCLYGLMIAKNHNSGEWGRVEVLLTRSAGWKSNLFDLYNQSIDNYFRNVTYQKREETGIHVSGKEISRLRKQPMIYTDSLENKTSDKNLKFIDNLHPQSLRFNGDGMNSLIKLVTDLTLHTGGEVQATVNNNVELIKHKLLMSGQKDLQNNTAAGLKMLEAETNGELSLWSKALTSCVNNFETLTGESNIYISPFLKFTIQDIRTAIQCYQIWQILIGEKRDKLEAQLTTLAHIIKVKKEINTILVKAYYASAKEYDDAVNNLLFADKCHALAKEAKEKKKKEMYHDLAEKYENMAQKVVLAKAAEAEKVLAKTNAALAEADVALAKVKEALKKAEENLKKAEDLEKQAKKPKKKNVPAKKTTNVPKKG